MTAVHNSEFVAWAADEDYRISFESALKYHAVLCDPPYGIAFMGKEWDSVGGPAAFQATAKIWGAALIPLLHPGALVFMFAGTRMWHRLAAGMEDSGFHLWDTLMWLYGQGFPKAQDISKLIDKAHGSELSAPWTGHKTPQLKPAWEPVLCFRAPSGGKKYAELALEHGSGALNVDKGRLAWPSGKVPRIGTPEWGGPRKTLSAAPTVGGETVERTPPSNLGRYPANLILDPESAELLDEQTGELKSGSLTPDQQLHGGYAGNDPNCYGTATRGGLGSYQANTGGASRFFYCAKASRREREAGLTIEPTAFGMSNQAKAEIARGTTEFENSELGVNSVKKVRNNHPTVKPIALNKWLAALLLPPSSVKPRRILVPFAGVGSEMIGCVLSGWDEVVGVEMDERYCCIAEQRLAHWEGTNVSTGTVMGIGPL